MGVRRRSRRNFRLTREGRAFLGLTIGVGLAAVNTGNNLLYLVLGLMLSLLLLSGALSDLALWGVRAERSLPKRLFVGQHAHVEVRVTNEKKRLPSFALEVSEEPPKKLRQRVKDKAFEQARARGEAPPLPQETPSAFVIKVSAGATERARYRRPIDARGWLELEGYTLKTRYPFGLIEKYRVVEAPSRHLVFPAVNEALAPATTRGPRGDEIRTPRVGGRGEIAGIREYRASDEARSIHWRRSAALGDLVVRERERESRARLSIVLDQRVPGGLDAAARARWNRGFEEAISEAAGVAQAALRDGVAAEVLVRGDASALVLPGASADPIFRFLALLEAKDDDAPLPTPRGQVHGITVRLAQVAA
ncbi:MAG: DUF58 domain-containing protein [Myxococcota bacterium]